MADFNSKYTGEQVEEMLDQIANGEIGGGGIDAETDPIFSASPAASITEEKKAEWDNKVDKVSGKQLSTEDFTSTLKNKLEGLSNYDDTELSEALTTLREDFDKLVSGDTTTAIKTFNEIVAFLDGINDTQDLSSIIASIEQQIAGKMDKVTLATVATSGSYNDLLNKPTIPSAVTESTVSGWGFTKNTGTYSKPSTGIPKTDLASAIQTSLGKADNAFTGSILGFRTGDFAPVLEVSINGENKTPNTMGKLDLGNTITGIKVNNQEITPSNGVVTIPTATTSASGTVTLSNATNSTSTTAAATPKAVKAAYDLANGKQDNLVSGTNIKTINNQSILGDGDITIEGGSSVFITHFTVDEFISSTVEFTDEQTEAIKDAARKNKIIALPYTSDSTGFLVSSSYYRDGLDGYWSLSLTIVKDDVSYNNTMNSSNSYFRHSLLTIKPFNPLVESVQVDKDGCALADSYNKDNIIVFVEGECRYLQIGEVGSTYGMTVRFFTGVDCTIDYWGNWANGVIPTIEPYTAYEMSIVYGADYNPWAVLIPFKQVES